VLALPDLDEFGKQFGLEVHSSSPKALAKLRGIRERMASLIKAIGFSAES
jgi:hypothetical protein